MRLPNRLFLEGIFHPHDTIADLTDFVRSTLSNPQLEFCLTIQPPRQVLSDPERTLMELGLVPAAIVNVSSQEIGAHSISTPRLDLPSTTSSLSAEELDRLRALAPYLKDEALQPLLVIPPPAAPTPSAASSSSSSSTTMPTSSSQQEEAAEIVDQQMQPTTNP